MTHWIFGGLAALFALLGGILASRAIDAGMFTFGLGLIGFGVFFIFWLMKDNFDQAESSGS